MMKTVNIHEAKTHLSRLIDDAMQGESFVIAKAGKPMVRVEMIEAVEPKRLGFLQGAGTVPTDFDTMAADDIAEIFEGRGEQGA